MVMAHEIVHVLKLAHENVDKDSNGEWLKLWKVSPYDEHSSMHSYYSSTKTLTQTDYRAMNFYDEKFNELKCGLIGGQDKKCKKVQRDGP
jgi:hypothetical protein